MEWDGIPFKLFKVMLVSKQRLYGMKDSRKTVARWKGSSQKATNTTSPITSLSESFE